MSAIKMSTTISLTRCPTTDKSKQRKRELQKLNGGAVKTKGGAVKTKGEL